MRRMARISSFHWSSPFIARRARSRGSAGDCGCRPIVRRAGHEPGQHLANPGAVAPHNRLVGHGLIPPHAPGSTRLYASPWRLEDLPLGGVWWQEAHGVPTHHRA